MPRTTPLLVLASLASLFAASTPAPTNWVLTKTFPIGGPGSWDYVTVDPQTHRLYVPRTTHTLVIEGESGAILADLPGQKNAHGVALAPRVGRGFISDGGGEGAILIFDLKTNTLLGSLAARPDADGIIFDPGSDRVLVVSGRGKTLLSFPPDIDPAKGKIDEVIALRGEPEFLAADRSGKVYINLMTTNEVAVFDRNAKKIIAHWPVAPGGAPVGMALDEKQGLLYIGCRKPPKLIIMSTKNGKVFAELPIGESVDAVKIDGSQSFASTAGSQLFVAGETAPSHFGILQTVTTGEGARTMGLDPATHKIYLPSADFEVGPNGRRLPKPGTFKILVVSRQPPQ